MQRLKTIYKVLPVYSGVKTWFRGQVTKLNEHLADGWQVERVDTSNDALLYLLKTQVEPQK